MNSKHSTDAVIVEGDAAPNCSVSPSPVTTCAECPGLLAGQGDDWKLIYIYSHARYAFVCAGSALHGDESVCSGLRL